jgi:hypothetical protein
LRVRGDKGEEDGDDDGEECIELHSRIRDIDECGAGF